MVKIIWDALAGLTGYGQCGRCHRPWNLVTASAGLYVDAGITVAAMCDGCWAVTTTDERVAAFNDFMDAAESRGSQYGDRTVILAAVARQKPGPLGA